MFLIMKNEMPSLLHHDEKKMLYKGYLQIHCIMSGRSLLIGERPEYKPFRDLRSVPQSRFHFDFVGGGGGGGGGRGDDFENNAQRW
jgi:hypothetical protein